MKLAPTKKKIGDFFVMYGWAIVLVALLSYASFYWGLNAIDSIKNYEKIDYFFENYGLKDNTLSKDTLSLLKDKGVLESNVYDVSPTSSTKSEQYAKFGAYSDLCVLNQNDMDDMAEVIGDNFKAIDDTFKSNYKDGLAKTYSYYHAYNQDYAIKIYDPNDATYSSQFTYSNLLTFTKDNVTPLAYYLCIPLKSVNFGSGTTNGFIALNSFLKTYEAL
jgi:hypothetical protein